MGKNRFLKNLERDFNTAGGTGRIYSAYHLKSGFAGIRRALRH